MKQFEMSDFFQGSLRATIIYNYQTISLLRESNSEEASVGDMVSKWQRHLNHPCFLKLLKSYEKISTENGFSKPEFFLSSYRKPHSNFFIGSKRNFSEQPRSARDKNL